MDQAMVPPAQQHQVVEGGRSTVHPVVDVVGVAALRGTAGELVPCVAGTERPPDRTGISSGLAPDVEDLTVPVMVHRDDAGIARQSPRRFCGNADRRVIDFEHAVARHVGRVGARRGCSAGRWSRRSSIVSRSRR